MKTKDFTDVRIQMEKSSGVKALIDHTKAEYPEFYEEPRDYNRGVSCLLNSVLLPELDPETRIEPYCEVEKAYDEQKHFYQIPIALSVESQEAVRRSLEAHPKFESGPRNDAPFASHLKRIIQHFAVELAGHERIGTEENVDGSMSILGK